MQKTDFNHGWAFRYGSHPFDQSGAWESVTLPHDFMVSRGTAADSKTYRDGGYFKGGYGVYVKKFEIAEDELSLPRFIEFEGVYMDSEVFLNGNLLGRHPYGYTSFTYRLNKYLRAGENELKVTADVTAVPNSRWYSGAGIYRYVNIYTAKAPAFIPINGVKLTPHTDGRLDMSIEVEGELDGIELHCEVKPPKGRGSAGIILDARSHVNETISCLNPRLWSADDPFLYTFTAELKKGGEIIDSYETRFGFREIECDAQNGLRVNGKSIKLRGGCVHHDNGIIGSASFARSEERKVELLKASGFNAVRCAHNPPAPSFLDACDRLGMYVIDEAFDAWRTAKMPYDYHRFFEQWWQRDMSAMLDRDFNHPSVIIWSIGNEIPEQYGGSDGYENSRRLSDFVRERDGSRPITQAVNGVGRATDKTFEPLDIAGYNYEYLKYEEDHALFPDRVMIGTETVPKLAFENWSKVETLPYVIGDFVWTSLDYLGEAGIGRAYCDAEKDIWAHMYDWPWNRAYCGDIDVCGIKRPQSFYRDFVWKIAEKPYIAVHRPAADEKLTNNSTTFWGWSDAVSSWDWRGYEGRVMTVDVYSRGETVKLYLNGELVGEERLYAEGEAPSWSNNRDNLPPRYAARFAVPFACGTLEAVADDGAKFTLSTPGMPKKIRLTPDRNSISVDNDLCYIQAEITDENGSVCASASNALSFSVKGGELLSAANCNPKDTESFSSHTHRAYDGRVTLVLRSNGGEVIILDAIGDGLDGTFVKIKCK